MKNLRAVNRKSLRDKRHFSRKQEVKDTERGARAIAFMDRSRQKNAVVFLVNWIREGEVACIIVKFVFVSKLNTTIYSDRS